MNINQFKPTGEPKPITDFLPGDAVWTRHLGLCFKTYTSDGLIIVRVETGVRIPVNSTEMFQGVEL